MKFKVKENELWAYLGITLMLTKVCLSMSTFLTYSDKIDILLSLGASICLGIHIVKQKYTLKLLGFYFSVALLSLYSVSLTRNYGMLVSIITIMAIRSLDLNKVIRFMYRFELAFMISHTIIAILLSFLKIISIYTYSGSEMRYNFGMNHANSFSAMIFNLFLMWIWMNYEKMKLQNIGIMFLISTFFFAFTKTRTSYLIMLVLFTILFIHMVWKKSEQFIGIIAKYSVISLCAFTLILMLDYRDYKPWVLAFDMILNGRVRLWAYAYAMSGFTWLGRDLSNLYMNTTWDATWQLNAFTFDSTYPYLAVNQGAIWLIIILIIFWKLAKLKDNKINVCIIGWALYAVTETQGLNCYTCFPLMLVTYLFSGGTKNAKASD